MQKSRTLRKAKGRSAVKTLQAPSLAAEHYATTAEAARELGVTPMRVGQFIKQGRLEAQRWGRTWMILRESLRDFSNLNRPRGRPVRESTA